MSTHLTGAELEGRTIYSSDGEKLGKIDQVLVDDAGNAQCVEVRSGWFGARRHTVPFQGITQDGDDLRAPYTKAQLESAPTFDDHEDIDYDREQALGAHYGTSVRDWDDSRDTWLRGEDLSRGPTPETRHPGGGLDEVRDTTQGPTPETRGAMRMTDDESAAAGQPATDERTREGAGIDAGRGAMGDRGRDLSGPTTDSAMTRSEEEMRVGTRQVETGRVRLRKWIETEPVSETVTTHHERARLEREPITDANIGRAMDGPELSEEEHELTLRAEEPVVEKRVTPKERVRLEAEDVTEQRTITDEIRKERIEAEGDIEDRGAR
jgi:uncharacterized protein (TIGR02271 family)